MQQLWNADEDIRSLKSLILFGIRGMAAYAYHAYVLNFEDPEVNQFSVKPCSRLVTQKVWMNCFQQFSR